MTIWLCSGIGWFTTNTDGENADEIPVAYPQLKAEHIYAALEYAAQWRSKKYLSPLHARELREDRFPAENTALLVRFRLHSPTGQAIRDIFRKALLLLENV